MRMCVDGGVVKDEELLLDIVGRYEVDLGLGDGIDVKRKQG